MPREEWARAGAQGKKLDAKVAVANQSRPDQARRGRRSARPMTIPERATRPPSASFAFRRARARPPSPSPPASRIGARPPCGPARKAPHFPVFQPGHAPGAATETSGASRLPPSGKLDDPGFPAAISPAPVETDGAHGLVWSRGAPKPGERPIGFRLMRRDRPPHAKERPIPKDRPLFRSPQDQDNGTADGRPALAYCITA